MNTRGTLARLLITLAAIGTLLSADARATGISIDAGLTPAEGRWIFRTQMRYMQRDNDPTAAMREMNSYMFPFVVAHGVRSNLAVIVRQALVRREMTMMGATSTDAGLADLLVMAKYRLVRVNTAAYTFGIAPTIGLEMPTGADEFTSDTWDARLGFFVSGRAGFWGADVNVTYIWNGMGGTDDDGLDPGDEFSVESALAYRFPLGARADMTLEPVIESSYQKIMADAEADANVPGTGESVLLLSPGLKFTWSSYILEGLVQLPVWQDQSGQQTERAAGFLIGIRIMN